MAGHEEGCGTFCFQMPHLPAGEDRAPETCRLIFSLKIGNSFRKFFASCAYINVSSFDSISLLQPLPIAEWKWEHITMDLASGFPRSSSGQDAIWIIVDRLTKKKNLILQKKSTCRSLVLGLHLLASETSGNEKCHILLHARPPKLTAKIVIHLGTSWVNCQW